MANQQDQSRPRPVTSLRSRGLSAKERKRAQRERDKAPILYQTEDWRLFTDLATLPQKAGCQPDDLRATVLKELIDNACDSGGRAELTQTDDEWIVTDDGPGLDPADVPVLFCVNRPLVSSKLRRMPTRGALGNGLRVVVGAVAAYDGSLTIETRGRRLALTVCQRTGRTLVTADEPISPARGLTVRIGLGPTVLSDAVLARDTAQVAATAASQYDGPSSAWWYGARDLHRLFMGATPADTTTVGSVIASFGLEYRDDRLAGTLDQHEVGTVLERLREIYQPVSPEKLGALGGEGPGYAKMTGTVTTQSGAVLPYIVEVWANCEHAIQKGRGNVGIATLINRSRSALRFHLESYPEGLAVAGCGIQRFISGPSTGNYNVRLSVITPHIQLSNDGKEPVLTLFSEAICECLRKACGAAHRLMRKPGRRMSKKDAAWQVMPAAYALASANGTLPANTRQIMYAARPMILELTGKTDLGDHYFSQTLLPNYLAKHPEETSNWDVVYDARGHFIEPHTGREVALGTLEVRAYLDKEATDPKLDINFSRGFPTCGPENRYETALFIEKEGFRPLLERARIADRFDIAIMSTKGMSVTAARQLLDGLVGRGVERVLVMHDFDVSGFSIFGTLGTDGRRYRFTNQIPIIDLGLRLTDVAEMNLGSEPVAPKDDWESRVITLEEHGATPREIAFLRTRRVELNAMPSDIFVEFIERKLTEHGVGKMIPSEPVIERHARRILLINSIEDFVGDHRAELEAQAEEAELPADLRSKVEDLLRDSPELPWDLAVAEMMEEVKC